MSTPGSTVTDTSGVDPCPYCGTTVGVRLTTDNPPKVRAWSCAACDKQWAVSLVNPRPYFDRLAATVELAAARSVLGQVITLADQAPGLTDEELRARLAALSGLVR